MSHSKKWTEAHAKVSSKPPMIYGYTPDQWDAAKAQFTAHLYTGDDAEASPRSEKGAAYVTEFASAGLLQL